MAYELLAQRINITFSVKLQRNGTDSYKMLQHIYGDREMKRTQIFALGDQERQDVKDHISLTT
jgi:hypothetical protein